MKYNERFEYWVRMGWYKLTGLLMGYPREYTVYPEGEHKRIRHAGGVWTLKPVYTYDRRPLSFIKHNYRYGWHVVKAPERFERFTGMDNLTEKPGEAIHNMLSGEEMLERFRDSTFTP